MEKTWSFPLSKKNRTELFRAAIEGKPQVVVEDGKKLVAVISYEEYIKLLEANRSAKHDGQ